MTREEKLLLHVKRNGVGVEIGASHAPIAPKRAGYDVHIIDHATRTELLEKYKDEDVKLDNIEEVDFVWSGQSYAELTGKTNFYDWIIASHVIEHIPNLVGFINSCDEILNENGVLSLAVPDSRFCFDYFRPISGLSKVLDAHFQDHKVHTAGSVAEFRLNLVNKDSLPGWGENTFLNETYSFQNSKESVLEYLNNSDKNNEYVDCHAWCFTPHSFRLLMQDLYDLGLIRMREVGFFPSEGCEFYIALSRNGKGSNLTRLELLREIDKEKVVGSEPALLLGAGLQRTTRKIYSRARAVGGKGKRWLKALFGNS
jgi:hypothetical protein